MGRLNVGSIEVNETSMEDQRNNKKISESKSFWCRNGGPEREKASVGWTRTG